MEDRYNGILNKISVVKLLRDRELKYNAAANLQRYTQVTESLIKRLGLEFELEGHKGCVNCIEWSRDGRRLASGSDDTRVLIWDPFRHRKLHTIHTPHIGNIFSVKFLGGTNDPLIVTGAGDCHVVVQSVDQEPGDAPLVNCLCHASRVKRIATLPEQPQLFWSAGEDGLILQFDLREPHHCISGSTVFLDLTRNMGWAAEAKCLAINPTRTHLVAVGANDCYVRVYDRRMVKVTPYRTNHHLEHRDRSVPRPDPALDSSCVQYYAPGHLARCSGEMRYKLAATYVTFDPTGSELLVNMGGEQVYLFDVDNPRYLKEMQIPETAAKTCKRSDIRSECCSEENNLKKSCRRLSLHNNKMLDRPCACQYLGRASTFLQRKWIGDIYAAARDYLHVIKNWPENKDGYLGLVRCLKTLHWNKIANDWLNYFRQHLPQYANLAQVLELKSDLSKPQKSDAEDLFMEDNPALPVQEVNLRDTAVDFDTRYLGHCNTTTDIKEANFFGPNGQYIIAGSDDGIFFIWNRKTTNIVRAMWGDTSIVNCVQPHPNCCLLATSGIDPVVKLWSPLPERAEQIVVRAYGPYIEPSDYYLFCFLQNSFNEKIFASLGDIKIHVDIFFESKYGTFWRDGIMKLPERLSKDGSENIRVVTDPIAAAEANQQRISMDPFETMLANMGYRVRGGPLEAIHEIPTCRTS